MTKERFRQLVKRLHPDASGTNRTRMHYEAVIRARDQAAARSNYCQRCGEAIKRLARHCRLCHQLLRRAKPTLPA